MNLRNYWRHPTTILRFAFAFVSEKAIAVILKLRKFIINVTKRIWSESCRDPKAVNSEPCSRVGRHESTSDTTIYRDTVQCARRRSRLVAPQSFRRYARTARRALFDVCAPSIKENTCCLSSQLYSRAQIQIQKNRTNTHDHLAQYIANSCSIKITIQ